jgi:adenylate kinase
MLYYHLPVFSCLYLTEQRKQDIENFSEKMLGVFEKRIAIHRADPLWRFPSENKKTLESIKEVIRFIQKNNFDIIACITNKVLSLKRYIYKNYE